MTTKEELISYLNTQIVSNKYIFLDYWSFVHLLSGIIIMWYIIKNNNQLIKRLKVKGIYFGLFVVLFLYEVFELAIYRRPLSFISPEALLDLSWDIAIGML